MAIQYTATGLLNKLSENNYSYTNAYRKKVYESNKDVETLQGDVAGLKKNVKALGNYSKGLSSTNGMENIKIYYKKTAVETKELSSKTRLEKQLKSLAKTYNSMNKDVTNISDEELQKQMKKLEKLFDENEKDLKKIGLKKKDGKYVFDSEVFADADSKVIKRLSEGKDSFVKQTDKIMRNMEARLEELQYSVVERNMMSTTKYDKAEINHAQAYILTKNTMELLGDISDKFSEPEPSLEEYKKEAKSNLNILTANLNYFFTVGSDSEDDKKLKALCEDPENASKLEKVGITIEEDVTDRKRVKYNEPDFDDPNVRNEYMNLFGKNSEFAKNITDCCNDGYYNVIKPEKIGVSVVDIYA